MISKTRSKDWTNIQIEETNTLNFGEDDISWVYKFLGWKKNAKDRYDKNTTPTDSDDSGDVR